MNISLRNFGLCFGIAFLLASCGDENIVGFDELQPNQDGVETLELVLPLQTKVSRYDTLRTQGVGYYLTGKLSDPVFGTVTANAFTEVRPVDINPDIGDTAFYNSLQLQLSVDNIYGGELVVGNTQTINIHQASEVFEFTKVKPIGTQLEFYSFDNIPYEAEPIGQLQIPLRDSDTDGGTFLVDLDDALGEQLFEDLRSGTIDQFDSLTVQANFNRYFKGLALIGGEDNDLVFRINSNAKLILEYNLDADSTQQIEFFLNQSTASVSNQVFGFSEILTDRTGTETAFIDESANIFELQNNKTYVQAGAGVAPVIDLRPVIDLMDTSSNFLVNKVVLELEVADYDPGFAPPATLFFDRVNEDGFVVRASNGASIGLLNDGSVQAPSGSTQRVFAVFDSEENDYSINLTNYARVMALTAEEDRVSTFQLAPVNLTSSLNRAVFPAGNIRVRVIYSTFAR